MEGQLISELWWAQTPGMPEKVYGRAREVVALFPEEFCAQWLQVPGFPHKPWRAWWGLF